MSRRILLVPAVSLVFVATTTFLSAQNLTSLAFPYAQPEEVGLSSEKLDRISDTIASWVVHADVVGAELLIVKDDKAVFHEAYGWSDREEQRPLERGSIWSIKSMSKPFTAAAILQLSEDGKLSLDDPVLRYVPEFAGDERTTIRNLLTHTSGYAGLGDTADFPTIGEWVADWASQQPSGPFGEYVYSDFNYAALGYIAEQASGTPIDDFIEARLIEPLGLEETYTAFSPDAPWASRVNSRYRLNRAGTGYEKYWTNRQGQGWRFYPAAWGLWSTAMDYARFLEMWMDGGEFRGERVLKASSVAAALAPQVPTSDGWFYGYGWFVNTMPNVFGHGGFDGTTASAFSDNEAMVILLTHSRGRDHLEALENRLGMLAVFNHLGPMAYNLVAATEDVDEVEISPEERARYTGVYRGRRIAEPEGPDYIATIGEDGDHLSLSFGRLADTTYMDFHLVPLGNNLFAMGQYRENRLEAIDPSRTLVFSVDGGRATSLRMVLDEETTMSARRADPERVKADVDRVLAERWKDSNRIGIDQLVLQTIESEGVESARARHRALRESAPDSIRFEENLLNALGYRLLGDGRIDDAIAVFEMNVAAYPTAPNPSDSLGEAYLAAGRAQEAVASYERAVALATEQDHENLQVFRNRLERVRRDLHSE